MQRQYTESRKITVFLHVANLVTACNNLPLSKNAESTRLSTENTQVNFKQFEVSILKSADESKYCSYLLISFSCPPKAITVRIAARTSSATAPAFAYAACSLSVKAERT